MDRRGRRGGKGKVVVLEGEDGVSTGRKAGGGWRGPREVREIWFRRKDEQRLMDGVCCRYRGDKEVRTL